MNNRRPIYMNLKEIQELREFISCTPPEQRSLLINRLKAFFDRAYIDYSAEEAYELSHPPENADK